MFFLMAKTDFLISLITADACPFWYLRRLELRKQNESSLDALIMLLSGAKWGRALRVPNVSKSQQHVEYYRNLAFSIPSKIYFVFSKFTCIGNHLVA